MADTPLDLASLPCPQGCRWESGRGIGILDLMLFKVRIATISRDGEIYKWHVVGDSFPAYAGDYEKAAHDICDWIGLTPAPAGRTFTEAETKSLMVGAWDDGFLHGIKTLAPKWEGGIDMGEIRDAVVDAAIAAATDAKEAPDAKPR